MFISKEKLKNREIAYLNRIKELENILCPAEQHDYAVAVQQFKPLDGYGTELVWKRKVCRRCLKVIEVNEIQ